MNIKKQDEKNYKDMIKLYQLPYCEKQALDIARELMTSDNLSAEKMKDVEHVYFSCGGK